MIQVDLFAAHALGALVAASTRPLSEDDHRALAIEARDLAVALCKAICETEPCDVEYHDDVHGNLRRSACSRCGAAGS